MSSAISTEAATGKRRAARRPRPAPKVTPEPDAPPDSFQVWHFFVLMSLVGATAAVILSRQSTPEHLVLISFAIGAAGISAMALYRMLAPLATTDADLATEPLSDRLRGDLEREKALTLRSIKELEFDRAMGKLSQEDFDEMAGRLRARALGIMRQLDEGGGAYRAVIERELASRVGAAAVSAAPPVRPAPEAPPAVERPDAAARACACGVANDPDARFCKACGRQL